MDKLEKLKQLLILTQNDTITPSEVEKFLGLLINVIKNSKDSFEKLSAENLQQIQNVLEKIQADHEKQMNEMEVKSSEMSDEMETEQKKMMGKMQEKLDECKAIIVMKPQDGKDCNPEDVVPLVLEKIKLPKYKEFVLEGGQIVDEINALDSKPENQIDASHIKNLPTFTNIKGNSPIRNIKVFDETTVITKALRNIKFVGVGIQATVDNEGTVVITVAGGAAANESNGEVLTTVSGTEFTFANTPTAGGVRNIWLRETGQLLTETTDYTISGNTLTTINDQTGFTLMANYTF